MYLVDNHMVVFAFRYALGRESTAPGIVVNELKRLWQDLPFFDRKQIQQEIVQAIEDKKAGAKCDVEQWQKILVLGLGSPIWADTGPSKPPLIANARPKRQTKQQLMGSSAAQRRH